MMAKLGQRDDNDLPTGSEAASKVGRPLKAVVMISPKTGTYKLGLETRPHYLIHGVIPGNRISEPSGVQLSHRDKKQPEAC